MSAAHAFANEEGELAVGQILRFELSKRGWRQQTLADDLGLSRATVNSLINNRDAVVSAEVAMRLAKTLGRPAEFWMRKQFSAADLNDRGESTPSVVDSRHGRLSDVGIMAAIRDGEISVEPFGEMFVKPAALDLRVGSEIVTSNGSRIDLDGQAFWLSPQESVLVSTLEKVSLSRGIAGNIGGMARHAKKFIQYGLGFEIDPGFSGHLFFMLTNMGTAPYRIKSGMPVITVMFYRLAQESSRGYENKDIVAGDRLSASTENAVRDQIKEAFRQRHRVEVLAGSYIYRIEETNLALRLSQDLKGKFDGLFVLFLSEIQAVVQELESGHGDQNEQERRKRSLDGLWDFVWNISVNREALLSLALQLRGSFEDRKTEFREWVGYLRSETNAATCKLGEQAESLRITPLDFLLLIFKNSDYSRAQF